MGQACGCADSTASKLDEIANANSDARQGDKSSTAPGIQNKAANNKKTPWETSDQETRSYQSKTKDQMTRLQQLVIDENLKMVEELQSPTSGAVYHGYTTQVGSKCGWGTQVWPDGGKYEGEWRENRANGKG